MNKLTEIKRLFQIVKEEDPNAKMALVKIEIVEYLFSLLEEKNKALEFYADRDNYDFNGRHSIPMFNDNGDIARKALNTSKGEKDNDY